MLIRELPFDVSIRLWDTYLAESTRFSDFLPYVCAAFLLFWSKRLKEMDFQEMILFLQKTPTTTWAYKELEVVLSHAHMLRASFDDSTGHLTY
jgi:TBC1 domain family member 2